MLKFLLAHQTAWSIWRK